MNGFLIYDECFNTSALAGVLSTFWLREHISRPVSRIEYSMLPLTAETWLK